MKENMSYKLENRIDPIFGEEHPIEAVVYLRSIHKNYSGTTPLYRNLQNIDDQQKAVINNSDNNNNNNIQEYQENKEIIRKPLLDPFTRDRYSRYTLRRASNYSKNFHINNK